MKKKKIILPNLRYENSPDVDSTLRVGFEEERSFLRNDDRDIVLDLSEQFRTERANSKKYKFYGKMKMIFRNLYLGSSDYGYLRERLFLLTDGSDNCFAGYLPYDEFSFLRQNVDREAVIDQSVSSLDEFTGFNIVKSGSTIEHVEINTDNAYQSNWNFYLSYVISGDTEYTMKYTVTGTTLPPLSFTSGQGIPFRVAETSNVYILTSPVKHGISQGEYILVDEIPTPFYVNSVGNSIYRSEEYVLTISKSQVGGYRFNGLVNGKRCTDIKDVENSTSEYYVHKHKIIDELSDHIIDKVGFESPIWEDEKKLVFENSVGDNDVLVVRNRMESIIFDHFTPFTLSGITNNLGYTPTDLYTSVIFRNTNGYFTYPPKVGYSFHFHDTWVDEHFDGTSSVESTIPSSGFTRDSITTFTQGLPLPSGTILHGAFVEYDPKTMKERIISEAFHRFSSNPDVFQHDQADPTILSGASPTNMFGLYYQPHYRFKMRELSPYTETSRTNKIYNLPENARYFPNEKLWRWRDLYDEGYIDPDGYGTDYPYMNDIHFIHKDINFYLRNELYYQNKRDGITAFDNLKSADNCEISDPNFGTNIAVNPTPSVTPSVTPTPSITMTPSVTPTVTPTSSVTPTPSITVTPSTTVTPTPSITPSITPTECPV